jgi:hypothetical protein
MVGIDENPLERGMREVRDRMQKLKDKCPLAGVTVNLECNSVPVGLL